MEDEGSSTIATSKTSGGLTGWMESMFIRMSQTFVGLPILKLFDYCLYVAEKSAQWSLPSHEISSEENGKLFGKFELVRPLPWMLFLPGLVILRIIRGGLNVGAFIFGYPSVEAIVMVKFLQKSRRRLRSFHLKAAKSQRRRGCNNKDKILTKSLRLTLSTLFCLGTSKLSPSPPPIKMFVSGLDFEAAASPDEKSTTESVGSPTIEDPKRKFSQVSSDTESETILTKLEKCSLDDSMDDSDFNPAKCSAQSSTSSSGCEEDLEISLTELEDLKNDGKAMLKESIQFSPAVIVESSSEGEKNKSVPQTELGDIKKDTQEPVTTDSTGMPNAIPFDKTTSDKETAEGATETNETRVDSPELRMQIASRETTDDAIHGEACPESHDVVAATPSETESAPPPPPPPPPSTQHVADGEASQKRNGKSNPRPGSRGPVPDEQVKKSVQFAHEYAPHNQEKKSNQRKKQFYKHYAK